LLDRVGYLLLAWWWKRCSCVSWVDNEQTALNVCVREQMWVSDNCYKKQSYPLNTACGGFVFEHYLCLFTHREMDRLGIITPSHQDIIIASVQQDMLSQMQHMQHTMVPVWAGERIQTCFWEEFHLPHPCTLEGPFTSGNTRSWSKVRCEERERKAALWWTSIAWSFLNTMIWTWPQIALSYWELRLKPHPLIQFYFSLFYYLFREGWLVKAVHKQNGFQLSFFSRCFGLDLNKMCFVFARMSARVCVWCV